MRGMRDNNISRRISFLETNIPHGGTVQYPGDKAHGKQRKEEKAFLCPEDF